MLAKLQLIFFMLILLLFSSLKAEECKLNIGYSNSTVNSNITGYKLISVPSRTTRSHNVKHMRKAWNEGDFDIKVTYWDGAMQPNPNILHDPLRPFVKKFKARVIEKGARSAVISGDVTKIQCLGSIRGSDPQNPVRHCKIDAYFANRALDPRYNSTPTKYKVAVGMTTGDKDLNDQNIRKKHLRKIKNTGMFDAEVELVLFPQTPAVWKKLNVGDEINRQADLQGIRCKNTRNAPLSAWDKMIEDVNNASQAGNIISRDLARNITDVLNGGGSVINAPKKCLINRRNNYGNKYSGSVNKFRNIVANNEFSNINNYLMMQASGKTYFDQIRYGHHESQNLDDFMCGAQELYNHWGFQQVQFINTLTGSNAIVASNNEIVLVAVRGTQTPWNHSMDWDADSNTHSYSYSLTDTIDAIEDIVINSAKIQIPASVFGLPSRGKVHYGYASNAGLLAKFTEQAFGNIPNIKNKKIFITGHSLGAATAIMLSYIIENNQNYDVTATYAYASPEVGDERLTRDLYQAGNYYLTNNYRDPIPNVGRKPFENPSQSGLSSALFASKEITIFKHDHRPEVFPDRYSSQARLQRILQIQGGPQPVAFLRRNSCAGNRLSPEWHFHNGNFYIAHTYSALLNDQQFTKRAGTDIQPEFSQSQLCISEDSRTSSLKRLDWSGVATFEQLEKDRQASPFILCPCQ